MFNVYKRYRNLNMDSTKEWYVASFDSHYEAYSFIKERNDAWGNYTYWIKGEDNIPPHEPNGLVIKRTTIF